MSHREIEFFPDAKHPCNLLKKSDSEFVAGDIAWMNNGCISIRILVLSDIHEVRIGYTSSMCYDVVPYAAPNAQSMTIPAIMLYHTCEEAQLNNKQNLGHNKMGM